jgi:hypothetical protein
MVKTYLSMSSATSAGSSSSNLSSTVRPRQKGRMQDLFGELPRLGLLDADLLDDALFEAVDVAFDPARLVLGEERRALQLAGAASDHELVFPDDDADVVEDVAEGLAHAGEGVLLPVGGHRLGEVTRALDAGLSRRVNDLLPEPRDPLAGPRLQLGQRLLCGCAHVLLLRSRPPTSALTSPLG